jgi:hypothetical protein
MLYLHEKVCEDPWLVFETKKGPQAKILENNELDYTGTSATY